GLLDRFLGGHEFSLDLLFGIEVQPRLVLEGVIADLVPRVGESPQRRLVLRQRRILADNEEGDGEPARREEVEDARYDEVEVARKRFPAGVAVRLHIRPLVVEVKRQTGGGEGHGRLMTLVLPLAA